MTHKEWDGEKNCKAFSPGSIDGWVQSALMTLWSKTSIDRLGVPESNDVCDSFSEQATYITTLGRNRKGHRDRSCGSLGKNDLLEKVSVGGRRTP